MNSKEQFLELLLSNQVAIKAYIGACVRDRVLRDDLFQEVALVLWDRFDEFDDANAPFLAWARGIAANKILKEYRRIARSSVVLSPESLESMSQAYERTVTDISEKRVALEICIEQLPEKSRSLLNQHYKYGQPIVEIARGMKKRTDAVYQSLSRIRKRLAECVQLRMKTLGDAS